MKVVRFAEELIIKNDEISIILDINLISNLYRNLSDKNENGGVLYGYKLSEIEEYRICGFTCPFKKDIISSYTYHRLDQRHIKYIKDIWIKDKTTMYLGDWHSHPSEISIPSKTDENTWRKISVNSKTNSAILIFIIVSFKEMKIIVYNKNEEVLFNSTIQINNREIVLPKQDIIL